MTYALIENGIVTNVIYLLKGNAYEFPNAVNCDDYSVQIGDTYEDGRFYRDGEPIYSDAEKLAMLNAQLIAAYQEGVNEA